MACPDIGIRNFPIQVGSGILNLEDINKGIEEDLFIYVSWGPRSNAPKFKPNSPLLDEGVEGTVAGSSLRYNNLDYTLKTVQITKPQHATFVVGAETTAVKGEAVLIFYNNSPIGDAYLILCIPIIQGNASSGSPYIQAILSDRLNNRQLTLDSLIPSKRKCVTYSTCLVKTDSNTNRSVSANATVFVFVYGIQETANRIGLLRIASMGRDPKINKEFGSLILPDGIQKLTPLYTIPTPADYRSLIRYRSFPEAGVTRTSSNQRTDPTSSYQCVPLKPDENVRDGKLIIDTDKGVPLSQVLAEKEEDEGKEKGTITPGDVERIIAIIFGVFGGVFVLSVLAYIVSIVTSQNAGPSFPYMRSLLAGFTPFVFIAVAAGIVGFFIGFFTFTQ